MIQKILFQPGYVKANQLRHFELDGLPLPRDFRVRERNVISIPAGEMGGNHKHPRVEVFVGFGEDLWIIWLDEAGKRHEEQMLVGDDAYLFVVEPLTPHVVVNRGSYPAVLVELADGPNVNVERVDVLGS